MHQTGVTRLDFALYTVIDVHDEEPDPVFVGYRDPESTHHDLRDRLGLSSTDPVTGKINSQVTDPTLTDDKAKEKSEFVERLTDNGRHRGLIVIAPHDGDIERHTDEQAERVGKRLSSKCISLWICKGFCIGGSAPPALKNQIKTAIRNAIPDPEIKSDNGRGGLSRSLQRH